MVQAVRRTLLTAEVLVLFGDESNVILKFSSKFRFNPVSIIPHMLCIHLRLMSRSPLEKTSIPGILQLAMLFWKWSGNEQKQLSFIVNGLNTWSTDS